MGILISQPVAYGHTITAEEAMDHIFGLVLLNDWSARDVQFAEMVPLGPFNGKASATSISPWVIMPEALKQSLTSSANGPTPETQSKLAPHLQQRQEISTWDVELDVSILRAGTDSPVKLCQSNLKYGYWSPAQMVAHQASSGCGLATGDLIGTGTLSAPGHTDEKPTLGCLHELTKAGTQPICLLGQQQRSEMTWLHDGDEVIFTGWAGVLGGKERNIGFGELRGRIVGSTSDGAEMLS